MRILEAKSRDIYFIVDFSLSEIKLLKAALDTATFTFDGENDQEARAASRYVTEALYPLLEEIIDNSPETAGT